MKPHEQIRKHLWGNLWYLLPISYIVVDRFYPFDQAIHIFPLLVILGSVSGGLLYWGLKKFKERSVRKTWIWSQVCAIFAIMYIAINGIIVFSPWISLPLHIGLPILWFIAFYKTMVVGYDVPPMRKQTLENSISD